MKSLKPDQQTLLVWLMAMLLPIVASGQLLTETGSSIVAEWSVEDLVTTPPLRTTYSEDVTVIKPVNSVLAEGNAQIASKETEKTNAKSADRVDSVTAKKPTGFVARMKERWTSWWGDKEVTDVAQTPAVPEVSSEGKQAQKSLKSVLNAAKTTNPTVRSAGRKGDMSIPRTKAGVPRFSLIETKKRKLKNGKTKTIKVPVSDIPYLDIGEEEVVSTTDFVLPDSRLADLNLEKVEVLSSPTVMSQEQFKKALGVAVEKIKKKSGFKLARLEQDKVITMEKVENVNHEINEDAVVHELAFVELNEVDDLALRAFLLVEYGNKCHAASGLLNELSLKKDARYQQTADFHLAMCLHKMGLFSESIDRLVKVIQGPNKAYRERGIVALVDELPRDFETRVVRELKKFPIEEVPEKMRDKFNYKVAKASSRLGHYNATKKFAQNVSQSSDYYHEAQFVLAVAEYSLGDRRSSYERQKKLLSALSKNDKKKELRDIAALNLARMSFQTKQYDKSIQNFNEIKKDHPLWIQALTEQGWTQLLMNDHSGAIGNMYSLHSNYFQGAYKPESYAVRTIGYLNICQYGDARRTLEFLEQSHRPWYNAIRGFRRKNKTNTSHHKALVSYLNNPKQKVVQGLPYQVLREMGRHRDFLNLQENINNRVDEGEQYGFLSGIINKDIRKVKWYIRKSNERLAKYKALVNRARKVSKYAETLNDNLAKLSNEKRQNAFLKFELSVYKDSQKTFGKFRRVAAKQLRNDKAKLRLAAGKVLKQRLSMMQGQLKRILDNNELLRYEILAGSGENIRFQAAGGKAAKKRRIPAAVAKEMNWNFEGEIWEDEIGHYRSKLVNMCSKRAAAR